MQLFKLTILANVLWTVAGQDMSDPSTFGSNGLDEKLFSGEVISTLDSMLLKLLYHIQIDIYVVDKEPMFKFNEERVNGPVNAEIPKTMQKVVSSKIWIDMSNGFRVGPRRMNN
ncbi:hypothetical protein B0H17DRAFT_1123536 [Mycena rosella]|uniref:Uncharacterized protein n=1 Tax=Mycena rosella TaxID=1033263 RepID=A0AAD7H2B8_MYCRO|nr:hypothetical protein B0H17DRAFT_1123536 [Mycena rosella]